LPASCCDRHQHFLLPLAALRGFFEGFDGLASSAPPTLWRSASRRDKDALTGF
jgi:hypothetical protein